LFLPGTKRRKAKQSQAKLSNAKVVDYVLDEKRHFKVTELRNSLAGNWFGGLIFWYKKVHFPLHVDDVIKRIQCGAK